MVGQHEQRIHYPDHVMIDMEAARSVGTPGTAKAWEQEERHQLKSISSDLD